MNKQNLHSVSGQIYVKEGGHGLPGLRISLFDKDQIFDNRLGFVITDRQGKFDIQFDVQHSREIFDKRPDLYLKVQDVDGKILYSSIDAIVLNADQETELKIGIPKSDLNPQLVNPIPNLRLSGGLVAQEKLDTISKAFLQILDSQSESTRALPMYITPPGLGPISGGAMTCPMPSALDFSDILDTAWELIDKSKIKGPDEEIAYQKFKDILHTIIHRKEVRKQEQMASLQEWWKKESTEQIDQLRRTVLAKKATTNSRSTETLKEKDRIIPILRACVIAGEGDNVQINKYLSVILGEIRGLNQLDVVYRSAVNALKDPGHGLQDFMNIMAHVGRTCGPNDGPIRYPLGPEDLDIYDDLDFLEAVLCVEEYRNAITETRTEYLIESIDWGVGCPGTVITINGRNLSGVNPDENRVLFTHYSGWGQVEGLTPHLPWEPEPWTDTRVLVTIPEQAGPGPIDLKIVDRRIRICDFDDILRQGNAEDFIFEKGSVHIISFKVDGVAEGFRTFRVPPGTLIPVHWEIIPADAEAYRVVNTEVSDDSGSGSATHEFPVATLSGGEVVNMTGSDRITWRLIAQNPCRDSRDERTLTFIVDHEAISIEGIEITQAVQKFNITGDSSQNNTVSLVARRSTMVRVYVNAELPTYEHGRLITGQLTVRDSESGETSEIIEGTSIRPGRLSEDDRNNLGSSINFVLHPEDLSPGIKEFNIELEYDYLVGSQITIEETVADIEFSETRGMQFAPFFWRDQCTNERGTMRGFLNGLEGVKVRFPVPDEEYDIVIPEHRDITSEHDLTDSWEWALLINKFDDFIIENDEDVGTSGHCVWSMIVPDNDDYAYIGAALPDSWYATHGLKLLVCRENWPAAFTHEVGHTFGILHAPCPVDLDWSLWGGKDDRLPDDGHYHETGIDVTGYRLLPPGYGELMSYCGGFGDSEKQRNNNKWPSVELWEILFDLFLR